MMIAALILAAIALAFTIIAIVCAVAISRPRETRFGRTALRPDASDGRFSMRSTSAVARLGLLGGSHV